MIVLDTHALIWLVQGDAKLGEQAREAIAQAAVASEVLVPAIVFWEVALAVARKRISLGVDIERWIELVQSKPGFRVAPLEPEIALGSVALAWAHKDPADRMIVATARHRRAPLITADHVIQAFAAETRMRVIDAAH